MLNNTSPCFAWNSCGHINARYGLGRPAGYLFRYSSPEIFLQFPVLEN